MSVKTTACFWVECDNETCAYKQGWPEDGPWHFDSEHDAYEYVLAEDGGWARRPDGRLLCQGCSRRADCAVTGHQWTDWRYGYTGRGHEVDTTVQWRMCDHCNDGPEERFTEMGDGPVVT